MGSASRQLSIHSGTLPLVNLKNVVEQWADGTSMADAISIIATALAETERKGGGDLAAIMARLGAVWVDEDRMIASSVMLARVAAILCESLAQATIRSPEEILQTIAVAAEKGLSLE